MDIGQFDQSEDVTAVQQRRPFDRSNKNISKSPKMCENPSPVGLPIRHHQHRANRLHETRNRGVTRRKSTGKKKRLLCYRCGGKGHPARLCPSADDCQDVHGGRNRAVH